MRPAMKILGYMSALVILSIFIYEVVAARLPKRPHIVIIVLDDVGYNDVSYHGSNQIPTPNIDALAYNGIILNKHYALPICTPSRTSLLTGKYAIREGMQSWPLSAGEPRGIPLNTTLMPEYFRELGYETRLIGKWHLGYKTQQYTPSRRGFDSFFGYYNGLLDYYDNTVYQELLDNSTLEGHDLHRDDAAELRPVRDSKYFTDLITDEAERIIKANGNTRPLFLEMAHLAAHTTSDPEHPLKVRNQTENDATFHYIKDPLRRNFAGVITAADESVGRVVSALSEAKMLDNTIIVMMSDNGAPTFGLYANAGSNHPMRGIKWTMFEGGVRTIGLIFSPLLKAHSRVHKQLFHITDWMPTLYTAAGGDISRLGEIDGLNQWPTLNHEANSPRQDILLNIDDGEGIEGALSDRFKLIKGAKDETEGYYGDSGNDPSNPAYSVEAALNSTVGQTINRLYGFKGPSTKTALTMRDSSIIHCGVSTNTGHSNCSNLCLFDLTNDPCETTDVSKRYPKVVKNLETMINDYRKVKLPAMKMPIDMCANPKYFNGFWMPWRRIDGSPVAIQCEKSVML